MSSSKKTFQKNRSEVMADLSDGVIFAAGDDLTPRNSDVSYLFRQSSNFLYLTGVETPGYALLMDPKRKKQTLFIPRITQHHRVWEGDVPGIPEHKKIFGFEDVRFLDELPKAFGTAMRKRPLYTDAAGSKLLRRLKLPAKGDRKRYDDALSYCRARKSTGEVTLMRRANEVSSRAHVTAMQATNPGMREFQVQAALEAVFMDAGMKHSAYPAIVAGGANGACLHYRDNDDVLRDGDLLLIDAGCEHIGYASDITRTFPVNGHFTPEQRDVYEVVLAAQKACITAARNGVRNSELHRLSQAVTAAGLLEMGILKVRPDEAIESGAVRLFYPHGIGHMLGIDVHDCTGGKRHKLSGPKPKNLRFDSILRPGMVITIEPGIYFIKALLKDKELRAKHKKQIKFSLADKFLKMGGIRIEDNVVIQKSGPPLNLTTCPKEVKDVEAAWSGDWD